MRQRPSVVVSIQNTLFGWIKLIEDKAARQLVVLFIFPYLFYTLQFLLTDYLIKYRSKRNNGDRIFEHILPIVDDDDDVAIIGDDYFYYRESGDEEGGGLVEMSIPIGTRVE